MKKELTGIYKKTGNGLLVVSRERGVWDKELTVEEFIAEVETSNMWNDIGSEVYEFALEQVGLDYNNYDDPDEMWDDYLEAVENYK